MITHDAALDAAHGAAVWEPVTYVDFYSPAGVLLSTQEGVTEGELTMDADSWPRTEARIVLPTALTAGGTTPPVSPYGGTCRIRMGARIGAVEYVHTVATLDVAETDVSRPEATVTVRAVSHEARVNEDRYDTRSSTSAGSSSSVVTGIVRRTLGGLHPVSSSLSVDPTLAAGAFPLDGDVWPTVEAIMDAAGGEAWFAPDGTLILRDAPTPGTPVYTFRTGEDPAVPGTLTGYRSTRGWAVNRVAVVYEEATGATPGRVVGLWEDTTGTLSAVSGPYGRHTRVERVSVDAGKLPSSGAANAAAAAIAKRAQGGYRSVELRTIPAPWIEPGDTVAAVLLGGETDTLVVSRVTLPLTQLDVMTLEGRDPSYTA